MIYKPEAGKVRLIESNNINMEQGRDWIDLGCQRWFNKLTSNLTTIQAVLQDAEDKQFDDESIRNWLRKLNHLSFEIDDVLDESVTELGRLEFKNIISKCIKKILCKHKIARRIKKVTPKLEVVAAERANFHLSEATVVLQSKLLPMRQTGSVLNKADLVLGRDEDREKIIDILVKKVRDVHELSVLPIIGLGGLGKTTLARLVFNDKRVTEHFEIKLWVCVSDNFDQKALIKAMIRSATKGENDSSTLEHLELDPLQHKLSQLLHQKRYLLVLDDVWNDDQEKWLELKEQLACGKRAGCSIIVTTREKKVADIMATTLAHNLKGLSEENCWLLFKERAFGHEESEHTELEAIGRQIVKKCAGVPLAATTLGGLLRFQRREEEWIHVRESPIWRLQQNESSILPALRLSYNHLPLTHRYCFAYCAVFPKDSEIVKEELICQWMAHGYISSDGTSDVEEIGDKIFNELVMRSLLLNVTTDDMGRIWFQMHDLVHDLAQSIMENKVPGPQAKLDSTPISSTSMRHVNLRKRYAAFPRRIISDMDLFSIFTQYNRLRSLDASWSGLRDVPPSIGKLKQLRYLNLSYNIFEALPEELCSLWNLKILDLNRCSRLKRLPKGMNMLRNLRHLFLEECDSLGQMPPKIGELTSLKTMSVFIVGEERNNQIGELQSLDLLGGKLEIKHLERVQEKYLVSNRPILAEKQKLRHLELKWARGDSSRCRESLDEKVLKALEPHANVETLEIVGFGGNQFPLWMRSSTVQIKLVELCIEKCYNCKALPEVLVEFPHLKKLKLNHLLALVYIAADEACALTKVKFPVVEELELRNLDNLKGLLNKETGECFPNLKKLNIQDCFSLLSLPQLPSLQTLGIRYCSSLLSLPEMSSLQRLEIHECSSLLSLPQLSALQELDISNCSSLLSLQQLPSLEKLVIRGCSSLSSLPWLPNLAYLLCSNSNITSVGGKFDRLSTLIIRCDRVDVGVPKECLTNNLKSLTIYDATQEDILPEEGLQDLKSLKTLIIEGGGRLRCLPGRWLSHLTSLDKLTIKHCLELVDIAEENKYLHNLKIFGLYDLPKMVCLPNALQHCTALKSLHLEDLPELESLPDWLSNFTSLQTLEIIFCKKVVSIPSAIQQLTQLKSLTIRMCSRELEKRSKKGKGDDWHKIAHIPNIRLIGYCDIFPKRGFL